MATDWSKRIGGQIERLRRRAKLSKAEAARRAGVTWANWHKYETGAVEPQLETLERVAQVLGARLVVRLQWWRRIRR